MAPTRRERQPAARTLGELQVQLDAFREVYNEQRPHRAICRRTPGEAYRAMPKALPSGSGGRGHWAGADGRACRRLAGRLFAGRPLWVDAEPMPGGHSRSRIDGASPSDEASSVVVTGQLANAAAHVAAVPASYSRV
jgi:hypothetical protein